MRCLVFSDLHLHPWTTYSEPTDSGPSRLVDQFNTLSQLVNYARENKVCNILFLGDLFHSRKSLETSLLCNFLNYYNCYLSELKIIAIAGNHDFTGDGKCFTQAISDYTENFLTYSSPLVENIGGCKVAFLPWETEESKLPDADIAVAHLEIKDVWYNRIMQEKKGITMEILEEKYKLTILGHYHMYQEFEKVVVVGSLNRLTRTDKGYPKGFLDLDLETLSYKFVQVDTFDFPDIEVVETQRKSEKPMEVTKEILSFEEALELWLQNQKRGDLLERVLKYWESNQ